MTLQSRERSALIRTVSKQSADHTLTDPRVPPYRGTRIGSVDPCRGDGAIREAADRIGRPEHPLDGSGLVARRASLTRAERDAEEGPGPGEAVPCLRSMFRRCEVGDSSRPRVTRRHLTPVHPSFRREGGDVAAPSPARVPARTAAHPHEHGAVGSQGPARRRSKGSFSSPFVAPKTSGMSLFFQVPGASDRALAPARVCRLFREVTPQ